MARLTQGVTFARARDIVLLLAGLALLGHETLLVAEPRYLLIAIAAAMIGLPATFLADRRFTSSPPTPTPADPSPPAAPLEPGPGPGSGQAA